MSQVRKSCSCGISAIYFQCCFMIETQVLMIVSNFSGFILERGFTFNWGGGWFWDGGTPFLSGGGGHGGHWFWWGGRGSKKIIEWEGDPHALPTMGNPVNTRPHCFINKKCFAQIWCKCRSDCYEGVLGCNNQKVQGIFLSYFRSLL